MFTRPRRLTIAIVCFASLTMMTGHMKADILDDILGITTAARDRATQARDRATEARDRATAARDNALEIRTTVEAGLQTVRDNVRALILESIDDLGDEVNDFLEGRQDFLADGGCSVAVCQPFRGDLVSFLQKTETLANCVLDLAQLEAMHFDLSREIAIVQAVPGRLLFPLYVALSGEMNPFESGLIQRLQEMIDALLVLKEILAEPSIRGSDHSKGDPIIESELVVECGSVLTDPQTGEIGPGGPARARHNAKVVQGGGVALKLLANALIAAGETRVIDKEVQLHGYVGFNIKSNKKKKAGQLLNGIADAVLAYPGSVDAKVRHCTTMYTQNLILGGQQEIKGVIEALRNGDLNLDGGTDLEDYARFQRAFGTE